MTTPHLKETMHWEYCTNNLFKIPNIEEKVVIKTNDIIYNDFSLYYNEMIKCVLLNDTILKDIWITYNQNDNILYYKWTINLALINQETKNKIKNDFIELINENLELVWNKKNIIDYWIEYIKTWIDIKNILPENKELIFELYENLTGKLSYEKTIEILIKNQDLIKDWNKIIINIPFNQIESINWIENLKKNLKLFKKKNNILINIESNTNQITNNKIKEKIKEIEKSWVKFMIDSVTGKKVSIDEIFETIDIVLNSKDSIETETKDTNSSNNNISAYQVNKILESKKKFLKLFNEYNNFSFQRKAGKNKITYSNKKDNIQDFFDIMDKHMKYYINYQDWTNSEKSQLIFNEALLRVQKNIQDEYWIDHLDILDIYNYFWKEFEIFEKIIDMVVAEIDKDTLEWIIAINLEVNDILNPKFSEKISLLVNEKNKIIFEILENQQIPEWNQEFKDKITDARKKWFEFAIDDIFTKKITLDRTIKNLENIWEENISIIKIDWETIWMFYNIFALFGNKTSILFKKIKKELYYISNKYNVQVVAEWIDSKEKMIFSSKYLWVNIHQGYHIQDMRKDNK